ncbi:MAG: SURF1 family protein [Corynebacterium sp.]|nr:SURF1 family protein [Corynebacterium sp.]
MKRQSRSTLTGWKVFFSPGWIITFLLVVSFSYAAFTILSPWQLNKDAKIVDRNNHIEDAFHVDPKPYSEIYGADGAIKDSQEWMRVTLTGQYLNDHEVILRLRPVESTPALQALTPFRLESGEVILINRGFEPTTAGQETVIPPAPTGTVTIVAHARVDEQKPQTAPRTDVDPKQVYGINTEQVGEIEDLSLAKDYAQLSDGQPGLLHFIPIPKLDRGNHLSYGFQWIAFGIMAPLGFCYFIWSETKERRRLREEEAEMALLAQTDATAAGAAGTNPTGTDPEPTDAAPVAETAKSDHAKQQEEPAQVDAAPSPTRQRSRYGNQHPNHYERFAKREQDRF